MYVSLCTNIPNSIQCSNHIGVHLLARVHTSHSTTTPPGPCCHTTDHCHSGQATVIQHTRLTRHPEKKVALKNKFIVGLLGGIFIASFTISILCHAHGHAGEAGGDLSLALVDEEDQKGEDEDECLHAGGNWQNCEGLVLKLGFICLRSYHEVH